MDDRDKDLTHLFVRDLDALPLPSRGDWRRATGAGTPVARPSRYLIAAGAVTAVIVLGVFAGTQLRERNAAAAPSVRPSQLPVVQPSAIGSAAISASPRPADAVSEDDFGLVFVDASGTAAIRRESSSPRIATIDAAVRGLAISPDGRQVAWFTRAGSAAVELRLAPAADPSKPRTLVTLKPGERGGGIAWANDGSGVAYSAIVEVAGSGPPGTSIQGASVHTFDLRGTSGLERTLYETKQGGVVLVPVAWDRPANVVAFGETGEGGYLVSWDVTRLGGTDPVTTRTVAPVGSIVMNWVRASSDAKFALGLGSELRYWPVADFAAGKTVPGTIRSLAEWRPGTHQIGSIRGDAFVLFQTDDGSSTTAFRGVTADSVVRTFRADGSAVVIASPGPGAGVNDFTLTRLADGASVTFQDRGNDVYSVRFR